VTQSRLHSLFFSKHLKRSLSYKQMINQGLNILLRVPSCKVSYYFTESQNGRGWKGPLGVTQPNPLPKQGHPEQAAQDLIQVGLEYLQRRRIHDPSGQPVPGLRHPQSSSSCSAGTSSASVCARCPLSCRWAPLKRVWPHPPDTHPADIYKIPSHYGLIKIQD